MKWGEHNIYVYIYDYSSAAFKKQKDFIMANLENTKDINKNVLSWDLYKIQREKYCRIKQKKKKKKSETIRNFLIFLESLFLKTNTYVYSYLYVVLCSIQKIATQAILFSGFFFSFWQFNVDTLNNHLTYRPIFHGRMVAILGSFTALFILFLIKK